MEAREKKQSKCIPFNSEFNEPAISQRPTFHGEGPNDSDAFSDKQELRYLLHNSRPSTLEGKTAQDGDPAAMTIEFLRARLLSERTITRAAKQKERELLKKVTELQQRLEREMKMVQNAEKLLDKAEMKVMSGSYSESDLVRNLSKEESVSSSEFECRDGERQKIDLNSERQPTVDQHPMPEVKPLNEENPKLELHLTCSETPVAAVLTAGPALDGNVIHAKENDVSEKHLNCILVEHSKACGRDWKSDAVSNEVLGTKDTPTGTSAEVKEIINPCIAGIMDNLMLETKPSERFISSGQCLETKETRDWRNEALANDTSLGNVLGSKDPLTETMAEVENINSCITGTMDDLMMETKPFKSAMSSGQSFETKETSVAITKHSKRKNSKDEVVSLKMTGWVSHVVNMFECKADETSGSTNSNKHLGRKTSSYQAQIKAYSSVTSKQRGLVADQRQRNDGASRIANDDRRKLPDVIKHAQQVSTSECCIYNGKNEPDCMRQIKTKNNNPSSECNHSSILCGSHACCHNSPRTHPVQEILIPYVSFAKYLKVHPCQVEENTCGCSSQELQIINNLDHCNHCRNDNHLRAGATRWNHTPWINNQEYAMAGGNRPGLHQGHHQMCNLLPNCCSKIESGSPRRTKEASGTDFSQKLCTCYRCQGTPPHNEIPYLDTSKEIASAYDSVSQINTEVTNQKVPGTPPLRKFRDILIDDNLVVDHDISRLHNGRRDLQGNLSKPGENYPCDVKIDAHHEQTGEMYSASCNQPIPILNCNSASKIDQPLGGFSSLANAAAEKDFVPKHKAAASEGQHTKDSQCENVVQGCDNDPSFQRKGSIKESKGPSLQDLFQSGVLTDTIGLSQINPTVHIDCQMKIGTETKSTKTFDSSCGLANDMAHRYEEKETYTAEEVLEHLRILRQKLTSSFFTMSSAESSSIC